MKGQDDKVGANWAQSGDRHVEGESAVVDEHDITLVFGLVDNLDHGSVPALLGGRSAEQSRVDVGQLRGRPFRVMNLHQVVKLVELRVRWMSGLLQEKVTRAHVARQYDVVRNVVWGELKLFGKK